MARRAQSSLRLSHLLGLVAVLAVLGGGGYALLHRTTDTMTGVQELGASEYLEDATALSGNIYKIEGIVDDRLDQGWRQADGRLFSVQVSDGSGNSFVPVWVPPDYQGTNIQRGQRYTFKVRVLESGVLEVLELLKV
jgi:hypothetical protein